MVIGEIDYTTDLADPHSSVARTHIPVRVNIVCRSAGQLLSCCTSGRYTEWISITDYGVS